MAPCPSEDFEEIIVALLTRFCRQNGATCDMRLLREIASRLRDLVKQHGLPTAVASEAASASTRLSETECVNRARYAMAEQQPAQLAEAVRQLVKALFYPELKECRLSFEARGSDGRTRRQEIERVRQRISGAHCVDCPHWTGLRADAHREFLAARWREGSEAFFRDAEIWLPEDFRALRAWIARQVTGST